MFCLKDSICLCDECPIGRDEIISRRERLKDFPDWQPEYCGCDKVDAPHYVGGYCEDAFVPRSVNRQTGTRKTGRAYRREKNASKKKRRMDLIRTVGYKPSMGYVEWDFVDGKIVYTGSYIKYPRNSKRTQYWKNQSDRRIRRYHGAIPKGGAYKKFFEYFWMLY